MCKRGEIYYIYPDPYSPSVGHEVRTGRPGIIVSNNIGNERSGLVEVVYMTTKPKRDMPTHVEIRSTGISSTAMCEQITTVSKERMGDICGTCTEREMQMLDIAIMVSLGIDMKKPEEDDMRAQEVRTKVLAERDLYKAMYENLLERVIGK